MNLDTLRTPGEEDGFNVFVAIPAAAGANLQGQMVIVAAHLDSWAAGMGAADDGAGVVIAMEAIRILRLRRGRQPRNWS